MWHSYSWLAHRMKDHTKEYQKWANWLQSWHQMQGIRHITPGGESNVTTILAPEWYFTAKLPRQLQSPAHIFLGCLIDMDLLKLSQKQSLEENTQSASQTVSMWSSWDLEWGDSARVPSLSPGSIYLGGNSTSGLDDSHWVYSQQVLPTIASGICSIPPLPEQLKLVSWIRVALLPSYDRAGIRHWRETPAEKGQQNQAGGAWENQRG